MLNKYFEHVGKQEDSESLDPSAKCQGSVYAGLDRRILIVWIFQTQDKTLSKQHLRGGYRQSGPPGHRTEPLYAGLKRWIWTHQILWIQVRAMYMQDLINGKIRTVQILQTRARVSCMQDLKVGSGKFGSSRNRTGPCVCRI